MKKITNWFEFYALRYVAEKLLNHINEMKKDAEGRIEREEKRGNKDLVEYFKGVKNACRAIELYIRRHLMTVKERSNV